MQDRAILWGVPPLAGFALGSERIDGGWLGSAGPQYFQTAAVLDKSCEGSEAE